MSQREGLILIGIVIGCFLLGILASVLYPYLKKGLQTIPAQAITLNADPTCNPVGAACVASDATMTITLELADRLQPLTLFPVRVHLTGAGASQVKEVAVSFAMLNMDMGFNRFELQQQVDMAWQGQALLPVCSMGRRDWRVTVEAVSEPPYVGEFHLLTGF